MFRAHRKRGSRPESLQSTDPRPPTALSAEPLPCSGQPGRNAGNPMTRQQRDSQRHNYEILVRGHPGATMLRGSRGRLLVAGHLQQSLHRAGGYAAQHLPAPGGARDGGDAVVRGETGDQTRQESRSTGRRAEPRMTTMDITIHASFLPQDDPDATLAFYRDTLGFEVRNDVGYGGDPCVTGRPPQHPRAAVVPHPPALPPRRPRPRLPPLTQR